jgi:hypothetical protein
MTPRTRLGLGVLVGVIALVVPAALEAVQASAATTWVAPVNAPVWQQFLPGHNHYGVDLGAKRFVPIRAASAGVVVTRKCNAHIGDKDYSCDLDGSPAVKGCGWYVDIQHANGIVTRYCHMAQAPLVQLGDTVQTGQRIGYVGTSGNSSAVHLHFEVHIVPRGGVAENSNAVDPIPFMKNHQAPLGKGDDQPEPPPSQPPPPTPPAHPGPHHPSADLKDDGLSEPLVWRPEDGRWYLPAGADSSPITDNSTPSGSGAAPGTPIELGQPGDVPVVADYDGDGRDDLAVWRPSDGRWLVQTSSGAAVIDPVLGNEEDFPAPGDYDGDGKTNFAVWRPFPVAGEKVTGAHWLILRADGTQLPPVEMGEPGDLPVPADYDGDGREDLAVWRPSTGQWIIKPSSGIKLPDVRLGQPGDFPLTGDFDGDGLSDFSVWRPTTGEWFVHYANGKNAATVVLGGPGDRPAIGDYDGDGIDDLALWRPSDGTWTIRASSSKTVITVVNGQFGDIPVNSPLWINPTSNSPYTLADILTRRAEVAQRQATVALNQ